MGSRRVPEGSQGSILDSFGRYFKNMSKLFSQKATKIGQTGYPRTTKKTELPMAEELQIPSISPELPKRKTKIEVRRCRVSVLNIYIYIYINM